MKNIIFVILALCSTTVGAQYKKLFFNTLNVATGLPEAFVRFSMQDRYGYIWLGTQNGLVRYDGYKLKPYSMPGTNGQDVVNSSIGYIYEDNRGKLWIFNRNEGVYYYDRTKDLFIKQSWKDKWMDSVVNKVGAVFYWQEDKQPQVYWLAAQQFLEKTPFKILRLNSESNSLEEFSAMGKGKFYIPARRTIDLRQDANGRMWLVSDSLLSYFDNSTRSFKPWFVLPHNPKGDFFEAFQSDPVDTDILWMNTYDPAIANNPQLTPHDMGVIQLNAKTKQYKTFLPDAANPGALPASGRQIYTDSFKRVWISTDKGLSLYNRKNATFTHYPLSFFSADVTCVLAADKEGNLWIGGNFSGLYYLNVKSGQVFSYAGNGTLGDLPKNATVNRLGIDKSGVLWVSTPFAGISYLNRQKSLFAPIPITPALAQNAGNNNSSTYTICGKQGDSICFIKDSANLYAWHSRTNKYDRIDLKNKDAYKKIVSVVSGNDGTFWIASVGQGLYNYNPITKSSVNYSEKPYDTLSLNNWMNNLAADKEGILWIGTSVQGLLSFNKKTGKFTRYPFIMNDGTLKANNTLDDRTVICMNFDSDGILWIGTNLGGLNRFDTKSGKFTSYHNRESGFTCVVSILEDSKKRLWAGTYLSGLFLFDRKAGSFRRYSEKDGLLCNNATCITEDAAGNIWSFSERGMSRLNPGNHTITNFIEFKNEGRVFYNFKDAQGNLYFTSKNGMVSFNPLQLNDNHILPEVIIESVSYHAASSGSIEDTILFTEGRQNIELAYNENKINFQYVALHYADAANNQYAFQLVGYDEEWVQAGTQRMATYTNLSPGTYTFKVKASNGDGVWNEKGASFIIFISPPWWKTWWAYSLYVLIIGFSIWSYILYRSNALRKENLLLEQKVERRTKQLQDSIETLKATQSQLIQSEKMASLGELTAGIAHEIQNPLNFVNNFAEVNKELVDELQHELKDGKIEVAITISNDIRDNEEKISFHGKRADAIVKSMLQHSRSSSGQKKPTDINALCDEYLRLSYHGLKAKDQSFNASFHFEPEESLPKVNVVPQDIGRVLLNLINNAFQAVDGFGDKPTVTVSTHHKENVIEIMVADNGPGIPDSIKDKIFQPFFTTKPTGQGTGLGLSLSYDIVKAHGGELSVTTHTAREGEDGEGEGCEFLIQLPIA